jgi:hypothetical protein
MGLSLDSPVGLGFWRRVKPRMPLGSGKMGLV